MADTPSVVQKQPVAVAFIIAAVPVIAAFVLQIIDATGSDIPLWVKTVLTGIGPLLGTLAALWARAQVTPLVDPKLDADTPLVPAGAEFDPSLPVGVDENLEPRV